MLITVTPIIIQILLKFKETLEKKSQKMQYVLYSREKIQRYMEINQWTLKDSLRFLLELATRQT